MQTHGGGNSRKQQFRERLGVLRETAVKRHLPKGRWTRRHWIHASLFTTIGVLMATIVPGFSSAIQAPVSQPRNTLLLGVLIVAFPVIVALVATSQTSEQIAQSVPMSMVPGDKRLEGPVADAA